jgi:hypothetical protein
MHGTVVRLPPLQIVADYKRLSAVQTAGRRRSRTSVRAAIFWTDYSDEPGDLLFTAGAVTTECSLREARG